MASSKQIKISITSALNAAGIEATKEQVEKMSQSVQSSMARAAKANRTHWADIKAAWDLGLSAIRTVGGLIQSALKKAFDAETALTNFKTMLGTIDAAKQHVADLKQFASQTPLTFTDLSQASKTLLAFGVNVENVMPSLKTLGDISLGNAEKFQSLSLAFGKVASEGRLTGVTLKQMIIAGFNPLQEIAAKTGAKMDDLKKQMEDGEISFDLIKAAMQSATGEGGRFHNAMDSASKTGAGLFSTMSDKWTAIVTRFGEAFLDASKNGMEKMISTMDRLNKDGTIEKWAEGTAAALSKVTRVATGVIEKLQIVYNGTKNMFSDVGAGFKSAMEAVGSGGNTADAGMGFVKGYQSRLSLADQIAAIDDSEYREKDEKNKELAKKEGDAKREEVKKTANLAEAYAKERSKAEAKRNEENVKKAAEKAAKEQEKLDEKKRREEERARLAAERANANVEVDVSFPAPSGGGSFEGLGGDEYSSRVAALNRQYADIRARRMQYLRSTYRKIERTSAWHGREGMPLYVNGAWENSVKSPWNTWNAAVERANDRWSGQLEALRKQRRQLDEMYGNGGLGGAPSDAASRTANACEGILRHFEGGRFG